jgi:hypothetical protein
MLSRATVGMVASALNSAAASANEIEEVFGPAMVYNRAELEAMMADTPMENADEWIDEQVGMLLKFGTPVLSVARIEDGLPPRQDGYLVSIPGKTTPSQVIDELLKSSTSTGAATATATATATKGGINDADVATNGAAVAAAAAPLALFGRADHIHPRLLAGLFGATAASTAEPAYYGNITLTPPPASSPASLAATATTPMGVGASQSRSSIVSLSPRVNISLAAAAGAAVAAGAGIASARAVGMPYAVLDGTPLAVVSAASHSTLWAQLNDWRDAASEDPSIPNFGDAALFHTTAALVNAGLKTAVVARGVDASHPATLSAWRSAGTVKLLVGNLEGMYCGGSAAGKSSPYGYSHDCSIGLADPAGGYVTTVPKCRIQPIGGHR